MDDTIDNSRQAHEDTLIALVEAGLMEGLRALDAEDAAEHPDALIFYRLPHDVVSEGRRGGQAVSDALLLMGSRGGQGRVILAFDGWADDPRELFEIGVVVDFCVGLLLGPDVGQRSTARARQVLDVLLDEVDMAQRLNMRALVGCTAGRHWLVAAAYPVPSYHRTASGWDRDLLLNMVLVNALRGGDVPPGYGLPG